MAKEVKDPKVREKIEKWKETAKVIERGQQAASSLGGSVGGWTEPPSQLDYAYWAALPSWSEREAAALSLGLNPNEDHRNDRRFVDRKLLIDRAVRAGELGGDPIQAITWITWLEELQPPPELDKLVRAQPVRSAVVPVRAAPREKELEAQVQALQEQLAKATKPPATQRLHNALLVAYVAAVKGYGWDPEAKRSDLIKQLMDDFVSLNISGPKADALRTLFEEARQIAIDRPLEGAIDEDHLP